MSNDNEPRNGTLSKIVGAAVIAIILSAIAYAAGGVTKAQEADTAIQVLRSDMNGQLALIAQEQKRQGEAIQELKQWMVRRAAERETR